MFKRLASDFRDKAINTRAGKGNDNMNVICPSCKREVKINKNGNGRCVCGANIKVIDDK
jgi:hypothetical protein